MQEKDLKARVYKYYDLLRKELTGTVQIGNGGETSQKTKGVSVTVTRPRPTKKAIKWRSKGH